MKKKWMVCAVAVFMAIICGCALPLKMDPPTTPDLSQLKPYQKTAALCIPEQLKQYQYVIATSPFDKLAYPLGDQTQQLFQQCAGKLFDKVVVIDAIPPDQPVDVVLQPSIVKFNAEVPMPAYKPYTADMIYRMEVFDTQGEKLFTQTAAGKAQSSKGMMSGFSARSICAQVAQMAMADAAKQIMEGVAEAEELQHLR
jgi:hypothetical protein